MEIKKLKKAEYAGRKFTAKYKTNGYYDIYASGKGFEIEYKTFETTVEKSFDDEFSGNGWSLRLRSGRLKRANFQALSRVLWKVGITVFA